MSQWDREQKRELIEKGHYNLMTLAKTLGQSRLARLAVIPLWSLDPFNANLPSREPAKLFRSSSPATLIPEYRGNLKVMSWNIKYGGGRIDFFYDGHGDRVLMHEHEVLHHLQQLTHAINKAEPDILFIQEIDLRSSRSALIDQLRWLLDHTSLSFAAFATQWKIGWLPSHGLGAVDTGIAILSRYPIDQQERLALPLIDEQDGLTQYFFLRRCLLTARIRIPGVEPLRCACVHASAFTAGNTKRWQFDALGRYLRELEVGEDGEEHALVFGGDFNIPPPGASKLHGFEDCAVVEESFLAGDFRGQTRWLEPLYERYNPAVPLEEYKANESAYFSHTTDANGFWNRKLDYLFTNRSWVKGSGLTYQSMERGGLETMPLSDHAPVAGVLEL